MRLGALKKDAVEAAKLGLGAALAISAAEFIQSKLLLNGKPAIPAMWAPAFNAAFGAVAGYFTKRFDYEVGTGMIAGGVGSGVAAVVKMVTDGQTMAAVQADSAKLQGGFGFGRAFASSSGVGRVGRVGRLAPRAPQKHIYGVGTPDMSAAGMFHGATVAIEEKTRKGGLRGATVQFEPVNSLAGVFS